MFHPSPHNKRRKQGIIHSEKIIASPEGLSVGGVYARHVKDLNLPPESRYIQSIVTTPDGRILIITVVPCLANLAHVARTVQVDTTFGRTVGELNEWEFVIWHGSVERGKHLRFKRFTRGGNLITMGVDMEAAQVQGACDSFLPTNEPEFSGITTTDPDEFALYFVRACISHAKRGVTSLKTYVTPDVLKRLMDFPYLKTEEDLADFTSWISTLGIKKVQDWWKHKLQYPWILPSLIKSRSRIHSADWDITDSSTNLNDGQHHWTNQQTGVKLTILEAIEVARKVDFKTARKVKDSLETGILNNNSNNVLHRMGRNVQRKSNSLAKSRAAAQKESETNELQAQVDAAKAAKRVADQAVKDAQTVLSGAKGTSTRRKPTKIAMGDIPLLEASSGRVISPRRTVGTETLSFVPVASAPSDECDITQAAAVIPAVPIASPSAPPPVDLAPPAGFGNDLSWLDNFGFMADISRPLNAFLNDDLLGNTVANPTAGHADFLFGGNSDFNWLSASLLNDGGDFSVPSARMTLKIRTARRPGSDGLAFDASLSVVPSARYELPLLPLPPASSPYPSPAAPEVNAPSPIEALNADADEGNIVHSTRTRHPPKHVLESAESSVPTKAKKTRHKRMSSLLRWPFLI
ncbi:hypothetical protein DFH08DRAFT_992172 [Mycena albidolilacea]|uniref:Uncharacterized protein n=1 Tax=Mycena albidolilacea TaxID=1033008 RepID=A0AAD6YYN1_9AGAR|nr:hypothetical protein DFH08DRAFT_992172 [Mycena albidolilacea]